MAGSCLAGEFRGVIRLFCRQGICFVTGKGMLKLSRSAETAGKTPFFSTRKSFYRSLFSMMLMIALQNLIAYSVNIADNIMLGSYSQTSLSGAATVNQIFFLIQQNVIAVGDALVILASQYWGQGKVSPIRKITGAALKFAFVVSGMITLFCFIMPHNVLRIFSADEAIIAEGVKYLRIIRYTFLIFTVSGILMTALRAVEIVKISLYISIVSLVLNVFINYTLIFGNFGMPELGIRGAAIGTLTARIVELIIVLVYLIRDRRLALFSENFLKGSREMNRNFLQVCIPVYLSAILWAVTVPVQTAILGHLPGRNSSDVIAANSVVTTFYQYLKVISAAMGSAAGVMIGKIIGTGDIEETKAEARSISVICVGIGAVLAILFLIARKPLLSLYSLTPAAMDLANQMMYLFAVIIFSMTYMMPVSNGVIRGGGDTHFYLKMNLISVWAIVMPLSFMSAFWWKWPPVWVVLMVQSDQIFKSIPTFLRIRSYKWIHQMAK